MNQGQTKQFDTFDNKEDRRELVILFEKLGNGLPESMQRQYRATWLENLATSELGTFKEHPIRVTPCGAGDAMLIFTQIVGVLGVPIKEAAKKLDAAVRKREWVTHDRRVVICG